MSNIRVFNNTMYSPFQVWLDWASARSSGAIISWDITQPSRGSFNLVVNGVDQGIFRSQCDALGALWGWYAVVNNDTDPVNFEASVPAPSTPLRSTGTLVVLDTDTAGDVVSCQSNNWDKTLTHPFNEPTLKLIQVESDGSKTVLATGTSEDTLTHTLVASDVGKTRYLELNSPNQVPLRGDDSNGILVTFTNTDLSTNNTYSVNVGGNWAGPVTITPIWTGGNP